MDGAIITDAQRARFKDRDPGWADDVDRRTNPEVIAKVGRVAC